MDQWLAQIGLKGRALQSARRSCEDNFIDDLSTLRDVIEDRVEFMNAFPQAAIRRTITKALNSDQHAKIEETSGQTQATKGTDGADNRYADMIARHSLTCYST